MDNKKIGLLICMLRKEKKLTQKDLAEALGVTDKAVSKWERGLGYPDISLLQPLSSLLDISVNELLTGEKSTTKDEEKDSSAMNSIAFNVVRYSSLLSNQNRKQKVYYLMSILFIVAIFVCSICDAAINKTLTWAYYPMGGIIIAWSVLTCLLYCTKHKWLFSIAVLYITTVPYLFIIQRISTFKGWVIPLGLPLATAGFVYLLCVTLLILNLRINKWYMASIIILLTIALDNVIDVILENYQYRMLELVLETFGLIILLMIGIYKNKKR